MPSRSPRIRETPRHIHPDAFSGQFSERLCVKVLAYFLAKNRSGWVLKSYFLGIIKNIKEYILGTNFDI
jgi:hypothetical protein